MKRVVNERRKGFLRMMSTFAELEHGMNLQMKILREDEMVDNWQPHGTYDELERCGRAEAKRIWQRKKNAKRSSAQAPAPASDWFFGWSLLCL